MTDRKLLEAAAKAAGYALDIDENWTAGELPYFHLLDENRRLWRPLADDGDAMRLAMQCGMRVSQREVWVDVGAIHFCCVVGDTMSATRRAIVFAAAAMASK